MNPPHNTRKLSASKPNTPEAQVSYMKMCTFLPKLINKNTQKKNTYIYVYIYIYIYIQVTMGLYNFGAIFSWSVAVDGMNPGQHMFEVSRTALSMPGPGYYLNAGGKFEKRREVCD